MKKKERKKKVCVIIPARDEENSLAKCIKGLMHQRNYIIEIILVDDNSKDKTAKIAQQTFLKYNFVNFKIIQGKVLPEGWSGKTWALNQGKDLALKNKNAEYLLFIDADIFLEKEILQNVQKILEKKKNDDEVFV